MNFNLGTTTIADKGDHTITLFGCNTSITANSKYWNGPTKFQWKKSNQVLSGIPFGSQVDSATGKSYYISKYYIASPPVFKLDKSNSLNSKTIYDIGLVTPDEFRYDGKSPVQMVYLDYNILKPMHVDYIDVKFDKSFDSLHVDYVPFRVECFDFPWIDTKHIKNAKGGSGIGSLKKGTLQDKLFLPYYSEKIPKKDEPEYIRKYLDCEVTILNDILLNYKVLFKIDGSLKESINLKDYFFSSQKKDSLRIIAIPRDSLSIPCGCKISDLKAAVPY